MYPASFRYLRASSLDEAEQMFNAAPDARYLAGGQSLIPAMKQRLASPSDLIDLSRIPALSFIRRDGDRLVIGAATKHAEVAASPEAHSAVPALAVLAELIGDPAVRHLGTLGGSIANNDPAADYPAAVLALDAVVNTNRRKIPADAFFTGMFATALQSGEIVTQGSLARWYVPPEQLEKCADEVFQLWPPSIDTAESKPLAPPSVQRSCCHAPSRCWGFFGSTATFGSTGALR